MTNGEKLKEVFPSIELYEKSHDAIQINFNSVWWNAEYQEPTCKNDLALIHTEGLDEEIRLLKNEQSEKPRWIPVSERLPEDREKILCSSNRGGVFEGKYFDDDTDCQWYAFRNDEFVRNDVIDAWMPLPKPHREVEE